MVSYMRAYLTSLVTMAVFDAAWLGFIAPEFYKKHIGFIMSDSPNWIAGVAFYLVFIVGVTVFVVQPGWKNPYSYLKIALLGGSLGLVSYATYDFTNLATLSNWPYIVTIVDLIWGTLLTAVVSVTSVFVLRGRMKTP